MYWFDLDTLTDWGAILRAIVAIGTPIVQCLGGLSHYYAGLDRSLSVEQSERQSSVYVRQNSPRWVVNLFLPLVQ